MGGRARAPTLRPRRSLPRRGLWSEEWEAELRAGIDEEQQAAVKRAEEAGKVPLEWMFDDVFAELDATRRERLAAACQRFDQVLVTAAVEEDVPLVGTRLDVRIADAPILEGALNAAVAASSPKATLEEVVERAEEAREYRKLD